MIEELKGIGKEKEKIGTKDNIARLIELENEVMNFKDIVSLTGDIVRAYKKISQLDIPKFNAVELESYLRISENIFPSMLDRMAIMKGLYSGYLLSTLTARNKKKRKNTAFHLDGHGARFDYLFFSAKTIDKLVITNFKGKGICSHAGRAGSLNTLIVDRCEGGDIGYNIGYDKGRIGLVAMINSTEEGISFFESNKNCDVLIYKKGRFNYWVKSSDKIKRVDYDNAFVKLLHGINEKSDSKQYSKEMISTYQMMKKRKKNDD